MKFKLEKVAQALTADSRLNGDVHLLTRGPPRAIAYVSNALRKVVRGQCICCVAFGAQRDQVLFLVATRLAAEFEVVYLQVLHAPADLASPAVALQHLPMQFAVAVRIESESRAFAADLLHEAFRLTSERKASCCGLGRNL